MEQKWPQPESFTRYLLQTYKHTQLVQSQVHCFCSDIILKCSGYLMLNEYVCLSHFLSEMFLFHSYFPASLWPSSKSHLPQSRTVLRWGWSWKRWTGRILTSSVLPQWAHCGVWRCWSPLTAGGALLITTAATIAETSSPSTGALSLETTCSRQALKVWIT